MSRTALSVLLFATTAAARPAHESARELYRALGALRVDSRQVYAIRDFHLRRDAISLSFSEGKLAFLEPLDGRITGAVFSGAGHVIVMPRDAVERASLAHFLGVALLDQSFSRAYLRFTDNSAERLIAQVREAGIQPTADTDFATAWNSTVTELGPWHSLRVMADWLSTDPKPYFYAELANQSLGAFDVLVDHRREEQTMLGQTVWVAGERYVDTWASFPVAGSAKPPTESFLPLNYKIDTTIMSDRTLEGKTTLRLKAERGSGRIISLELSRFLKVESATDTQGQPLEFFQNEEVQRSEISWRGNDTLAVILPREPAPGEELQLQIGYRGRVISDAGNGVYFVGTRGSWYPHISGPAYPAPFVLSFRWPRRLQLVATGGKLDEHEDGEWRVGSVVSQRPLRVAGFNLGDYASTVTHVGDTEIAVYANRQLESEMLNRLRPGIDPAIIEDLPIWPNIGPPPALLAIPPPPSPASLLKELGQNIGDAIRFYESRLGPFPFERLAVSQIPGSFGQGWPGLLYLSTLAFLPSDTAQQAAQRADAGRKLNELMPYHEVAHQWWGHVVFWSSYRDQWIEEALANYLALIYADSKKPGDRVMAGWLAQYRNELTTRASGEEEAPGATGPLVLGYRLNNSKSPRAYTTVVYGKGSWVFHMVRMMLRDPAAKDPDARFWRLLRSLLEKYRQRALSTADLERELGGQMTPAMDLEGEHSMAWFFDQWVRGTGIPHYSVSFRVRPQGSGFRVHGTLNQAGVPDTFLAAVPLYASAAGGKPVLLGKVVTGGAETPFEFSTQFRPKRILIDPHLTVLCRTD